jgi:hypothetical protein
VLLAHQFTAVDDQGTSYQFSASLGPAHTEWSGVLDLLPNPPHEIRWLDLSTTPGEPATRIDLNSQPAWPAPPPEITVTPTAVSPGELLLTDIAAGFLALASPEQVPLHPSAARPGPLSQAADGLADDFLLWLRVVPPLDHGTPWIDVVAAGQSAEVRARLPLSWKCNP